MRRFRFMWLLMPILIYAGVRLWLGGSAFEANYGYSLFNPPPEYARRLYAWPELSYAVVRTLMALGVLWIGLAALRQVDRPLWRAGVIWCVLIVAAAWLYSSHIIRVIDIVYPPLVVGLLHLVSKKG